MSILGGPYDDDIEKPEKARDEELMVFGYACKLYRDDAKAILENSGQLLIPWMGDRSLMVDRYDVRNKLDDKSQFGLKPNLPRPMTTEEMDFEDELDKERYLALEWDEIRVEEQEEMEKRRRESAYSAVGFSYNTVSRQLLEKDVDGVPMDSVPSSQRPMQYNYNVSKQLEHPSTATVDRGSEDDQFIPPPGLTIPNGIQTPSTNKLHSIIEKTASFVCRQGNQMEIIIKTKQKFNPYFSFLIHDDGLFPYYKYLKEVISSGKHIPQMSSGGSETNGVKTTAEESREVHGQTEQQQQQQQQQKLEPKPVVNGVVGADSKAKQRRSKSSSVNDSESEDSDSDDEGYLHPLLLGGGNKSKTSSPAPPAVSESSSTTTVASKDSDTSNSLKGTKKMTLEEIMNLHNTSSSFVARSLAINPAPAMVTEGEVTQAYATDQEAVAAYEYYKQQYYNSNMAPSTVVPEGQQEGWCGYTAPVVEDHAAVYDAILASSWLSINHSASEEEGKEAVYYFFRFRFLLQHGSSCLVKRTWEMHLDAADAPMSGGPPQEYIPSNGQYHQPFQEQQHQQHSKYDPPPPPSEHQYPPPYYQCPPEAVPPPEIRAIVDKTAEYVAKNSEKFERTVLERHLSDTRFSFLNPWDPYNYYYEAMKQYNRSMMEMTSDQEIAPPPPPPPTSDAKVEEGQMVQKKHVQKLNSSGAVSFKLKALKGSSSAHRLTPASGFEEESYFEEDNDEEGEVDGEFRQDAVEEQDAIREDNTPSPLPPSKKQKVGDDNDEIGHTVQAFLSTVKGLFYQS